MTERLNKLIEQSIKLLQTIAKTNTDIELCYSGGKDSDVILELAKMAGIPFTAIYKNTTIDPPYTIQHCIENGVQIVQPKQTFFELIEKKGFPNRYARFCCAYLKEYKIKDTAIIGVRRAESVARAKRYKEPIICRIYNKKDHVNHILPILEWTKEDIEEFITERNIKLHPLYYNKDGTINCGRRLGCMACPLQHDRGLEDFKKYPKLVKEWLKHGQVFWDTHPNGKIRKYYSDIYEYFAIRIFHESLKETILNKEALFKTDYKKALEDYFNITL